MSDRVFNVLFLCTGNSARSILAEAILNHLPIGQGRFRAFSAGSFPRGSVHPYAQEVLQTFKHPVTGLRSKSWDEFSGPDAPSLDFIFTVCDNAAGEICPIWPGKPMTAHWGIPDPAAVEGSEAEIRAAFHDAYGRLRNRIGSFVSLLIGTLDRLTLQQRLTEIGSSSDTMTPGDKPA